MNDIIKYNPRELATKAIMHALMKAGIKVHLATPEMFAKEITEHRSNIEMQMGNKRILYLKRMAGNINKWVNDNNIKFKLSFNLKLPYTTEKNIFKTTGRIIKNHKINSDSFIHILKGHGERGVKNNPSSIPIKPQYLSLIPYILTAPDKISMGSIDSKGCASIKYTKTLSNGYVLVVEKENKNNPLVMETVTMWAELESNVLDARKIRPQGSTSETVTIGSYDIAKIIKDAENAIREDVKNQIDKQINYFYGIERTESVGIEVFESNDITNICRKGNTLYGWTFNGEIYLTPEGINPDTPVHEYTHLWANAMMIKNPDEWAIVKSLLSEKQEWQGVVNDPLYKSISDDDDRVASETLARLSGKSNMQLLAHYAEDTLHKHHISDERSLINKMLDSVTAALRKFWGWVAHTVFHIPQLQSVQQVTDRILYDLVNSIPLQQEKEQDDQPQYSIGSAKQNRITDINIIKQGVGYGIRCKVDGVQQPAETIKFSEELKYDRIRSSGNKIMLEEYLSSLAEKYFSPERIQDNNIYKSFKR